jgi:hypothetical protein
MADKNPPPKEEELPRIILYCHLFTDITKGIIQTVKVKLGTKEKRVLDFKSQLIKELDTLMKSTNIKYIPQEVKISLSSPALNDTAKMRMFFNDLDDIYVRVITEVIPIQVNKTDDEKKDVVLTYKTITAYSFYVSSETYVRVLVPIPGIEKVKKEDIIAEFTDSSLDVRVKNGLNGNNYRFAVPRLDAKIIPEKCEAFPKGDRLIIRLRKAKNDDHWSYLFKQQYVGE